MSARLRVVVAMSGGVDSAVAAGLLVEAGHEVIGITMHLTDTDADAAERVGSCCAPDDVRDARGVATQLGIPHFVANYKAQFKAAVIDRFVMDYQAGRTPSPCVRCNSDLKFTTLMERALALGADRLATGHYARVISDPDGTAHLLRAVEPSKDQSYFLFGVTQEALRRTWFPIGGLTKDAVREHARRLGLPVSGKAESMDLCFVPDGDYAGFVAKNAVARAGDIVDMAGQVLGRHNGIHQFTVGQRKGLGLPGGTPTRFVIGVRGEDGRVVVGGRDALLVSGAVATGMSFIDAPGLAAGMAVLARVRHRSAPAPASVASFDPITATATIAFREPLRAVAPGQALVLYSATEPERVLGGGWIDRALPFQAEATPSNLGSFA